MLIDGVILAILLAWLSGGDFRKLADIPLKRVFLIVMAFGIQFGLIFSPGNSFLHAYNPYIHLGTYGLLFWALWENRRVVGMKLVGLGLALNFLVIAANGGKMPVSLSAMQKTELDTPQTMDSLQSGRAFKHKLMTEKTRLDFLGDVFYIPKLYPEMRVFSIGDVLLLGGIVQMIFYYMRQGKKVTGPFRWISR
ncbi:MAG: DUF5317 domain-containing protein [Candidatus Bipolaricaulia bacterium]